MLRTKVNELKLDLEKGRRKDGIGNYKLDATLHGESTIIQKLIRHFEDRLEDLEMIPKMLELVNSRKDVSGSVKLDLEKFIGRVEAVSRRFGQDLNE